MLIISLSPLSFQFERLKAGDRFFYTNSGVFTPAQLSAIKRMTLSRVLCDHADVPSVMKLPRDMFRYPGYQMCFKNKW